MKKKPTPKKKATKQKAPAPAPKIKAKAKETKPAKKTVAKPASSETVPDSAKVELVKKAFGTMPDSLKVELIGKAFALWTDYGCDLKEGLEAVLSAERWIKDQVSSRLFKELDGLLAVRDKFSPADYVKLFTGMMGDRPMELVKTLGSYPELAKQAEADPEAFARWLHDFHDKKRGGLFQPAELLWQSQLVGLWVTPIRHSETIVWAPLCFWPDSALVSGLLVKLSNLEEGTVRQFISRAGLVRPKLRFGVEKLRKHGRQVPIFTKRTSGTFGKKA
jgi:hypothetical protein